MDKIKYLMVIFLPILAWIIVFAYQHWKRHNLLKAQREEFVAATLKIEEIGRRMRGIGLNTPFPKLLPFRHVYGSPPPIGHGKPILIWIASYSEYYFREEIFKRWKELLSRFPHLILMVAAIGPDAAELKFFRPTIPVDKIKTRINHPRIYFILSDDSLHYSIGPPGTIIFIDRHGITRHIGKLKGAVPLGDNIEMLSQTLKKLGGD